MSTTPNYKKHIPWFTADFSTPLLKITEIHFLKRNTNHVYYNDENSPAFINTLFGFEY